MTFMRPPVGVLTAATMLTAAGCAPAPDLSGPWLPVDDKTQATLDRELQEALDEQGLVGLAMAVAHHDDHTLWVGTVGSSRLDPQADWQPDQRSRIGSVTKTFTTAMIYQLVEEGTLTLDDPVERWMPGTFSGMRIRHLLGHSSGIVSYNYVGNFDTHRAWTPDELVQWAWEHEPNLRFEPGTDWEYSNTNYVLLGLIIEVSTGGTYEAELQSRLLDPLQLDSMRMAGTGDPLTDDLVRCYSASPPNDMSDVDPSFGWAAGSLSSNPADLARWNDALFFGDVVSQSSLDLMMTPQGLTGEGESEYGLGLFYEGDDEYVTAGHTGGIAGYLTFAYTMQDPPVTLIVMANQHGTDLRAASTYGWAAVLGVDYP